MKLLILTLIAGCFLIFCSPFICIAQAQDSDFDGVPDSSDNCPLDWNVGQRDHERDLVGDVCDADDDNDGTADVSDNCPLVSSSNQTDTDGDGLGDVCDVLVTHVPLSGFVEPHSLAINPVTNRIYIRGFGSYAEGIQVLDGTNYDVLAFIPTNSLQSAQPTIDTVNNRIYVVGIGTTGGPPEYSFLIIDGVTNTVTDQIVFNDFYPTSSVINPSTHRLYLLGALAASGVKAIRVWDTETKTIITDIVGDIAWSPQAGTLYQDLMGNAGTMIAVNTTTNRLYTAGGNSSGPALTVIDLLTNSVITNVNLGDGSINDIDGSPQGQMGLALNPVTERIYITSSNAGWVTIVDGRTNSLIGYVDGVDAVQGIVVDSDSDKIYAAGYPHRGGGYSYFGGQPILMVADGKVDHTSVFPEWGQPPLSEVPTSNSGADYYGGIAYNPANNTVYIAGYHYNMGLAGLPTLTVVAGAHNSTQTGTDVIAQPVDSASGTAPVNLTFQSVTQSGDTTLTSSSEGPPIPSGFKVGEPAIYYDVETTALFNGAVTLCFSYADGQFPNENDIRLFHYESNTWTDVTSSVDTTNNKVCGQSYSLSPFALFQKAYEFSGFYPPVDNPPIRNVAKAGSAIPVKFSLGGDQGLAIFSAGYPGSQSIECTSNAHTSDIEETVLSGGSSLSYDAISGQYTYVWKTNKAWGNTCRRLTLKFTDGSVKTAEFTFTK